MSSVGEGRYAMYHQQAQTNGVPPGYDYSAYPHPSYESHYNAPNSLRAAPRTVESQQQQQQQSPVPPPATYPNQPTQQYAQQQVYGGAQQYGLPSQGIHSQWQQPANHSQSGQARQQQTPQQSTLQPNHGHQTPPGQQQPLHQQQQQQQHQQHQQQQHQPQYAQPPMHQQRQPPQQQQQRQQAPQQHPPQPQLQQHPSWQSQYSNPPTSYASSSAPYTPTQPPPSSLPSSTPPTQHRRAPSAPQALPPPAEHRVPQSPVVNASPVTPNVRVPPPAPTIVPSQRTERAPAPTPPPVEGPPSLDFAKLMDSCRLIIDASTTLSSLPTQPMRAPAPGAAETIERMLGSASFAVQMLTASSYAVLEQSPVEVVKPEEAASGSSSTSNRKKSKHHHEATNTENQVCLGCNATTTPEWRRGPMGPRTLCNACGLVYAKMIKKRAKESGQNGHAAAEEDSAGESTDDDSYSHRSGG